MAGGGSNSEYRKFGRRGLPISDRQAVIGQFLTAAGWGQADYKPLAGDASYRRYARLSSGTARAILMDAPPGGDAPKQHAAREYNAVAHLAVDCAPFVAVARYLAQSGFSAPRILAGDMAAGLLLLEDFGDALYFDLFAQGQAELPLYGAAIDLLLALHSRPLPALLPETPYCPAYRVPGFDKAAVQAELALMLDWYLPDQGRDASAAARREFEDIWDALYPHFASGPEVLVLRDYHAQNIFWLPDRAGLQQVGIIDFQDALRGSAAYDLVSLLEDARRNVAPELASNMLARYCEGARRSQPDFDVDGFHLACAIAGVQRNTRLLGTFTRLARRDGKMFYLGLIPRVRRYLERALAHPHPQLQSLQCWMAAHLPPADG
ncbi:MAG TPA: bifunctional tRNA (adenosine(37)-N6)-threonylcarbamoyltransferase complex ATPase subunit type 1 TsaE/phosphotransferase [Alphaproteobacteria bacterium]|nr:bifunctional tRNA (adenosine(37)-N6)-threonylcarbamoyltransferase complex ATPase subunit type 1 TsaE/phosphotransferase [Alphaproteobacteria bacterium]HBF97103.1 bifunctional tRNA (adenosine(37)-N6)-threonylcarbamoyltransferase complex ATPase subunit type 1 TsaE/phosphotransferase [Alphaproteobacteria bacterium]